MQEKTLIVSEKPFIKIGNSFLETYSKKEHSLTSIFIPAWLDTPKERKPIIESLREVTNVITYEPRGFGDSSRPKVRGIYGLDDLLDELSKLIQHYNLKNEESILWGKNQNIQRDESKIKINSKRSKTSISNGRNGFFH